MNTSRHVAVVGSRDFRNYKFFSTMLDSMLKRDDIIVSGGAQGVDSLAQRYAKEHGMTILIIYPDYARFSNGATFRRNEEIVLHSDIVLAFYARGRLQQGGTANTASWARRLEKPLHEYEEI